MKYDIEILIGKLFNGNISEEEEAILIAWYNKSDKHKIRFTQLKSLWLATHPPFNPESIDSTKAEKNILKHK